MKYQNAAEVLPPELLREVQKYTQGAFLYVPKQTHEKWGACSGSRELLARRNREIRRRFREGESMETLAGDYCLSVDSIRRIAYRKEPE